MDKLHFKGTVHPEMHVFHTSVVLSDLNRIHEISNCRCESSIEFVAYKLLTSFMFPGDRTGFTHKAVV